MRIELRYFTGTGNSWRVMETCKSVFMEEGHDVEMREMNPDEMQLDPTDILGFCFPVYAFEIPRICRKYLKSLRSFREKQKVFIIITAGDADESGFSIRECEKILNKKNCDLIYTRVIQMPINWTTAPVPPFPPPKEEALAILENGRRHALVTAQEIIEGVRRRHEFNYPKRYSKFRFYKDYYLFKYLGLQNMWRMFKVYESCNGCQTCAGICPTHSIRMHEMKPVWTSSCEQCMRCVNFCPREAIYQSMGGDTRGKNRYFEPGFKPIRKGRDSEYEGGNL